MLPADTVRRLSSQLHLKSIELCLPEMPRKPDQYCFCTQESQVHQVVPSLSNSCAFLRKLCLWSCFAIRLRFIQSSASLKWNISFLLSSGKRKRGKNESVFEGKRREKGSGERISTLKWNLNPEKHVCYREPDDKILTDSSFQGVFVILLWI